MPYDLCRLLTGTDKESVEFHKYIRSYNNNLSLTLVGLKYNSELTKNMNGVYAFRIQGQGYHFLNSLMASDGKASGVKLYFLDTKNKLSKRLNISDADVKIRCFVKAHLSC